MAIKRTWRRSQINFHSTHAHPFRWTCKCATMLIPRRWSDHFTAHALLQPPPHYGSNLLPLPDSLTGQPTPELPTVCINVVGLVTMLRWRLCALLCDDDDLIMMMSIVMVAWCGDYDDVMAVVASFWWCWWWKWFREVDYSDDGDGCVMLMMMMLAVVACLPTVLRKKRRWCGGVGCVIMMVLMM